MGSETKECTNCGYVMDFDHRPGEKKSLEVSRLTLTKSIRRVVEEIAKCDVVCANCHRIRTFEKKQRKLPS